MILTGAPYLPLFLSLSLFLTRLPSIIVLNWVKSRERETYFNMLVQDTALVKSLWLYVVAIISYTLQEEFMEEVRLLLHVCVMFLPIPVFFALFNQQVATYKLNLSYHCWELHTHTCMPLVHLLIHCIFLQGSKWTLQASKMNGKLGGITIQPDQMQALNPILMLASIPIFETVVYPLFEKCNLLKKYIAKSGMI